MSTIYITGIAREHNDDLIGREVRLSRHIPHHKALRPCGHCGGKLGRIGNGKGPHRLSLRCLTCRRVRWLSEDAIDCLRDDFVDLASTSPLQHKLGIQPAYTDFCSQKSSAAERGIRFLLSYEQWLTIWQNSGHWHERGRHRGQYVMSRPGDKGPYAIGNVRIVRAEENLREGSTGHVVSKKTRAKMRATMLRKVAAARRNEPTKRS